MVVNVNWLRGIRINFFLVGGFL